MSCSAAIISTASRMTCFPAAARVPSVRVWVPWRRNCQNEGQNYLIRGSKGLQERFIGNAFALKAERERGLKHPYGQIPHTR